MNSINLEDLKLELSLKAKNGLDFILAATVVWFAIAYVWALPSSSYDKSVLTFMVGSAMLPLALLLSKILKMKWKIEGNPLKSLGLWLNFAQLFYFPFLVFVLLKHPDYFVMVYVIITGAHFFPYAWFYNEKAYAVAAGLISVGALLLSLQLSPDQMFLVPVFMGFVLMMLAIWIYTSYRIKLKKNG